LKLQITIDGKAYEVDVEILEDEEGPPDQNYVARKESRAAGVYAQNHGGAWDRDGRICRSPMTGLVIKVNVQPGQDVAEKELMMVLEAMKMETNVTAPRAGTVKSVHVKPGDSVKMEQLLVEFE